MHSRLSEMKVSSFFTNPTKSASQFLPVFGVHEDVLHGCLPEMKVSVGKRRFLGTAKSRVGEIRVEILAVDGPRE